MNAHPRVLIAGSILAAFVLTAACFSERVSASTSSCAAPSDSTAGGSPIIRIVDYEFQPASTCVTAGSTVTWRNDGVQTHSAKADLGAWDSPLLTNGGSFATTLTQNGTLTYYCSVHPFMQASVVVQ